MKWLLLLGALLVLAHPAQAAHWKDCSSNSDRNSLKAGGCVIWTETGVSDSQVLIVEAAAHCDDVGDTSINVWRASPDATKLNIWWSMEPGATCGPTSVTDDCGTADLTSGWYVMVPPNPDVGTGIVRCKGDYYSPSD